MRKHQVGPEDRPFAGQGRLSLPRTIANRPLPSTIILNLVDDNLNGRAGIPTVLEYKYVYRISHLQSHDEDFLSQQYKQLPKSTGDRSASESV